MKKLFALLLTALMALSLIACSGSKNPEPVKPAEPESPASQEFETTTPETHQPATADMKEFGNEVVGYASVPSSWIIVPDEDSDQMQAYSPDYECTITLDVLSIDTSQFTVEQTASALWNIMEEDEIYDIQGAKVELIGYEAYQLYGLYKYEENEYYIVTWVFEDEDGVYRYRCAEGPKDPSADPDIFDTVDYLEGTYRIK